MCREKGPGWRRCECSSAAERTIGRRAKLLFGSAIGANRRRVNELPETMRTGPVAERADFIGSETNPAVLAVGLEDSLRVRQAAAGAPGLSLEQQESVAISDDRRTRKNFAGNPAGDAEILARLATDPAPSVRQALASNPAANDAALFALVKENSPVGRAAQASLDTPTTPVDRPAARPPATNRFIGTCPNCGQVVPKEAGICSKGPKSWVISHREGECPKGPSTAPVQPPAVEGPPVPAPPAGGPKGWQVGDTVNSPKNGWVTITCARSVDAEGIVTPMTSRRATRAEIAPYQEALEEQELAVTHRAAIERMRNARPCQDSVRPGGTSYNLVGDQYCVEQRVSFDPLGAPGGRLAYFSTRAEDTKRGWRVTAMRWQPSLEAAAKWASEHRAA